MVYSLNNKLRLAVQGFSGACVLVFIAYLLLGLVYDFLFLLANSGGMSVKTKKMSVFCLKSVIYSARAMNTNILASALLA